MGLAGRKVKQRIGADPRNLSWADDASRFGSAYLAKFGWDSSKGLGAAGDGRTSHVKVAQKLDMLGIGAANVRDPNGIAWKQNRDFENLLKRLNGEEGGQEDENGRTKVDGFVGQRNNDDGCGEDIKEEEEEVAENSRRKKKKDGKEGKKRKKGGKDKEDESDNKEEEEEERDTESNKKRKKRKSDLGSEGEKKRKRKEKEDKEHMSKKRKKEEGKGKEEKRERSKSPAPSAQPTIMIPRHRAHRARAIAAKKMLFNSATAMSEILGIAPIPTTSSATLSGHTAGSQGQLTTLDDDVTAEKITTSTKSVIDYFKEKLLSKSSGNSGFSTLTSIKVDTDVEAYDDPRGGLGSSRVSNIIGLVYK